MTNIEVEINDNYICVYERLNDDCIRLLHMYGKNPVCVVPDMLDGMRVTELAEYCFSFKSMPEKLKKKKGTTEVVSVKHILVVTPKKLNPGKVATAAAAEVSGEYAVSYYATYIDGKKKLEIDPLNYIYYVNGKDYLADVRKALGK